MWEITFALLVVVIYLWVAWRRTKFRVLKELGIPGPEPSFLFGNLLQLSSRPLECMEEWLEEYGDVMGYYLGVHPMVVVRDTEILKKVEIKDFQKFINRPVAFKVPRGKPGDGFTTQLVYLNDKRWKEVRSLLTPSFTARKLKTMASIINSAIDTLLEIIDEKAKNKEWFDIYELYRGLTMDVIGRTAFGIQTECQKNPDDLLLRTVKLLFIGKFDSIFSIFRFCFPEFHIIFMPLFVLYLSMKNRCVNPLTHVMNSIRQVIKTRRKNPQHRRADLLQLMIDAHIADSDVVKATAKDLTADLEDELDADEPLKSEGTGFLPDSKLQRHMNDNEILDNAMMFFLAGYETTSTTLAFTTHFLVHYPEVQERVRNEVKNLMEKEGTLDYSSVQRLQYLDQVITEALRLYPPIYLFVSREAGVNVNYENLRLKKGVSVQVPLYNIQRSKKYWTEPNKFDPERFSPENKSRNDPLAFQAFGAGPRNCVGMRFALIEAKLALARILLKYRLEKCEQTDELDITLEFSDVLLNPGKGVNLKAVAL